MAPYNVVFVGSAGGGVLSRLLKHSFVREMTWEVVSDRDCGFLRTAEANGVSCCELTAATGSEFSDALLARYQGLNNLVFLSFYTKIFSGSFVKCKEGRIFNCHPTILPAFKGMTGFDDNYSGGSCFLGSTIH